MIKQLKNYLKYVKKNLSKNTLNQYKFFIISAISTGLLFASPVLSIYWLILMSLYLVYDDSSNVNNLGSIWFSTLAIWYILFTGSMSSITMHYVIIGSENTFELAKLVLEGDIWFKNLCLQTLFIFHALSAKLNVLIYIPILPFTKINKTQNMSGKGEPKKEKSSWFSSKPKEADPNVTKDFGTCQELAKSLNNAPGRFYKSVTTKTRDGERSVTAGQVWVPGVGTFSVCGGTPGHMDPTTMKPNVTKVELPPKESKK